MTFFDAATDVNVSRGYDINPAATESQQLSRADAQPCGDRLAVHTLAERAAQCEDMLRLPDAVSGQPARRRDERLLPQLHRVAAAAGELAPQIDERLPELRGLLTDRPVGGHSTPRDVAAAIEEACDRDRVLGDPWFGLDANDVRSGRERDFERARTAHMHTYDAINRGERRRQEVARGLVVEPRSHVVVGPCHQAGLVEEQHDF